MKSIKLLYRGWLAASFIQQLALAFQHLFNPSILYRTFLNKEAPDNLGGHLFALICFQQSLLKGTLLIKENDKFLHIYHSINDVLYLSFFTLKIIYGDFILSNGAIILSLFAAVSLILGIINFFQEHFHETDIPEKRSRPRKLISSHYLESHISDYNPTTRKNK